MWRLFYNNRVRIAPLNNQAKREISTWEYPQELSVYSHEELADDDEHYFAVYEEDQLIGFGVTGAEAMVKNQSDSDNVLDVGLGMSPSLIRKGMGKDFSSIVLGYAQSKAIANNLTGLRCAILKWNLVSQKIALAHGFKLSNEIINEQGTFLEFELNFQSDR